MGVMGAITVAKLSTADSLSKSMAARTNEVENLRDSNSRQFESDRAMYLALHAAEAADRKDQIGESLDTLGESIDGYGEVVGTAATPQLKAPGRKQAAVVGGLRAPRVKGLHAVQGGRPVSAGH